ncbi:M1 family metallopeptidase [Shewanella woodyi]|uniref:Aminopeptidase n=1 Tax=Shewanella woodyi (strain ATCC 51908 / MS32) TaxID=392500 RepID=B1KFB9_SHEWM|nr:M1 family metallopeptidase [Shewanella woodyi]ACA86660.1 Peptidase M1 membrane alanine aminopeptidase [Shewanella woodyi ATCC 51908]
MYRVMATSLITAALLSCSQLHAEQFVLNKHAKPISQAVSLVLDPHKDDFSGSTNIQIQVLKKTKIIQINGVDYTTKNIKLTGDSHCDMSAKMLDTGIVNLICDTDIYPGDYQLRLDFTAPYNRQSVGLYKTIDAGVPYLFTQFEMSDARRSFPVFDEPEYKIPFQISITAPYDEKVYSNTPLVSTKINGSQKTHHFAQTKPLSSYLIAYAVGKFESIPVEGMKIPGNVITTQGKVELAKYAVKEMPAILARLENYFGVDYPYQKLDSVALPEFPFGAMENAGLVTYREDILLLDEAVANQNTKRSSISVIAHELAHQWYGNLVTMKWWNDLWLNEAFASWMAAKVTHELHPEFESHLNLSKNRVMSMDARLSTKPIRKPINTEADIMDGLGLAYSKGSAVLSMVENWIGEEDFKQGIRQYIKDHAFKNTSADDLWNALSKASGKDVAQVLSTFIEQASYPLIMVKVSGNNLNLSQERFVFAGSQASSQEWVVPVSIKYGKGDKQITETVLLDSKNKQIKLQFTPDWVYPDADGMGYYRWLLGDKQLNNLLKNAKNVLTDRERKALISSADALLAGGFITAGELLSILGEFVDDAHPQVVSSALSYLQIQKATFVDQSNEANWAKFISTKARSAINKYGEVAIEGESIAISKLRPSLISILAFEGKNKTIIAAAKKASLDYLDGSKSFDAYLIGTQLQIAVYYGDNELIQKFKTVFETTKNPQKRTQLMYALGFVAEEKQQKQILDYSLTNKLNSPDLGYIMYGQSYTQARKEIFRTWLYNNYAAVKNKLPPFSVAKLPNYAGDGCDLVALDKTNLFFQPKLKDSPEFTRSLAKLNEKVKNCVQLKNREQASVDQYLQKH